MGTLRVAQTEQFSDFTASLLDVDGRLYLCIEAADLPFFGIARRFHEAAAFFGVNRVSGKPLDVSAFGSTDEVERISADNAGSEDNAV